MEVPGLGVKSELQLQAYTIDTTMLDPSCFCNIHHSLQQCQILNPLSKARIEPASSWILLRFVTSELYQELHFALFFDLPP